MRISPSTTQKNHDGFFEHDICANEVIPGSIPSDIPLVEGTNG